MGLPTWLYGTLWAIIDNNDLVRCQQNDLWSISWQHIKSLTKLNDLMVTSKLHYNLIRIIQLGWFKKTWLPKLMQKMVSPSSTGVVLCTSQYESQRVPESQKVPRKIRGFWQIPKNGLSELGVSLVLVMAKLLKISSLHSILIWLFNKTFFLLYTYIIYNMVVSHC